MALAVIAALALIAFLALTVGASAKGGGGGDRARRADADVVPGSYIVVYKRWVERQPRDRRARASPRLPCQLPL
jgi:hypothetical protein